MSSLQDRADLAAVANGNDRALAALHRRHADKVFRFVLRHLRNEAIAEEIVNEAFIELWRKAGEFRGECAVSTWLLGVARNKAIDRLRRRSEEALDDATAMRIEDPSESAEEGLVRHERATLVRRLVETLSPIHREVVDLVYYQEQSVGEAARVLGVPEGTVKTRMFYARKQLARLAADVGLEALAA